MPQAIWCYLYIVFEYNFQSIDGLSMNLAITMFQGLPNLSQHGRLVSQSLNHVRQIIASFPARNGENPQIVVKKK